MLSVLCCYRSEVGYVCYVSCVVSEVNRPSVLSVLCCCRSEQAKCVMCPVLLQK